MNNVRRKTKIVTIRRGRYLVELPVEVVFSPADAEEPIIESQTARFIDEVARHTADGDVPWLKQYGKVYELVEV